MDIASFCQWDNAKFLFFSDNVFDYLIYYSHLSPLLFATIAVLFILLKGDKGVLLGKILISMIVSFCVWDLIDLILWANDRRELIMFAWSIQIFFDLFIYVASFYFIYAFAYKKDLPWKKKLLLLLFFVPLFIFSHTNLNLEYFDLTNCDREAKEGFLWQYVYVSEIFLIFLILFVFLKRYFKLEATKRKELLIVTIGMTLFLVAFSWGNISGTITDDWSIGQYGLFGMSIFIGFLTYVIIQFKTFNIKLLRVQALVVAVMILIASQFAFIRNPINRVLTGITLILVSIFGWWLIDSVKKEVQRKEELEQLTHKLSRANARLKKLDEAKTEFISIASHQLRTPLTAVKGYLSLLQDGTYGKLSDEVKEVLGKIQISSDRLISLVEDLLSVSRIEAGRMQYKIEEVQICNDIMIDLQNTFELRAKDKGLKLTFDKPQIPVPTVMTDKNKIREVISNLIDNAIKYTEAGSVEVKVRKIDNFIKVSISDTGIGIPEDEVPYLFKKFSRGKDTKRLNADGTGLGIYLAKKIISDLNGKISVASEGKGKGSTFTIELPVAGDVSGGEKVANGNIT